MKSAIVKVTTELGYTLTDIRRYLRKRMAGRVFVESYKPRKRVCRWERDMGDSRRFFTECYNTHNFHNFDSISKNGFNACPYCGGVIVQKARTHERKG